MDFLTLENSKGGFGNILVITGHFTKYAVAIPYRLVIKQQEQQTHFTTSLISAYQLGFIQTKEQILKVIL